MLSDEKVKFVATHSDFVCFEKGHGINFHGSSEKGIEADAAKLKKINPDLKVIYYWNTFLDYPMYDAHEVYAQHSEWWLRKLDGSLDMENMMEAGMQGQIVIMKGWPGFNWTEKEIKGIPHEDLLQKARDNITYPLACFLVAAQPYSYFCYSWGWL